MSEYQKIKSKIEKLDKNETTEIFKIIHQNENKYTTNKNGVFVNLNICSEKTLLEINNFIDFIEESKKHLNALEDSITEKKNNFVNNNNMFSQSMSMHMDYSDNFNDNTRFISSDYSPFVTDDNYIIETSINDEFITNDNINNNSIVDFNDELEDVIIDDENNLSDDCVSNSIIIMTKKKKATGIKARILKRCKNINGIINDNTDDIDKENEDNIKTVELTFETEY